MLNRPTPYHSPNNWYLLLVSALRCFTMWSTSSSALHHMQTLLSGLAALSIGHGPFLHWMNTKTALGVSLLTYILKSRKPFAAHNCSHQYYLHKPGQRWFLNLSSSKLNFSKCVLQSFTIRSMFLDTVAFSIFSPSFVWNSPNTYTDVISSNTVSLSCFPSTFYHWNLQPNPKAFP